MTLQTDIPSDEEYNNILAFSSKSAGIKIRKNEKSSYNFSSVMFTFET